jgi:hypothetical protein
MVNFSDLQAHLQLRDPQPPLFPTQIFSHDISLQIARADDQELFGYKPLSSENRRLVRCGLLLMNDDLHASHDISQGVKTPTGSAWHAIMHRREGDASNSNYWWRLTGEHPFFELMLRLASIHLQMRPEVEALDFKAKMERQGRWNPVDFVTACSNASGDDAWLRELQMVEMNTLLSLCRSDD